jgi:hypothetical protein
MPTKVIPTLSACTLSPFIHRMFTGLGIVLGAGYTFGPSWFYSSTSFDVLKSISWFPIPAWGTAFMLVGFLIFTTRILGYMLGMLVWSTWWLGLVATALDEKLSGWGGAVYPLFFAALCAYEVARWGQLKLVQYRAAQAAKDG